MNMRSTQYGVFFMSNNLSLLVVVRINGCFSSEKTRFNQTCASLLLSLSTSFVRTIQNASQKKVGTHAIESKATTLSGSIRNQIVVRSQSRFRGRNILHIRSRGQVIFTTQDANAARLK